MGAEQISLETARVLAGRILNMPEDEALEYIRVLHNRICRCGLDGGPDGPYASPRLVLNSIREAYRKAGP
jgi:hypothetical protein